MPQLAKALLVEWDEQANKPLENGGCSVEVQFNPDSLKVSYANTLADKASGGNSGGDQSSGSGGRQFVGSSTTKLALTLWFDASTPGADGSNVDNVRRLTQQVTYFITPKPLDGDQTKKVPPLVNFKWGAFEFVGQFDSLEETLEYFSQDGRPLRASMSVAMSQQAILVNSFADDGRVPGLGKPTGTQPMAIAKEGANLPGMLSGPSASSGDWQRVAAANGIENPRQLTAGMVLNLNPPRLR